MGKKDARDARKAAKAARDQRKNLRLKQAIAPDKTPRVVVLLDEHKKDVQVDRSLDDFDVPKQIREAKNQSRFGLAMTWCARKSDKDGEWTWGEPRLWSEDEWAEDIAPGMNSLEGLGWEEIQKQSSGEGHLLHHDHLITDICDEAQFRWLELGLEEYDVIFRFRLGNTKRAWGIVLQAHFFMVWWERHHKIYEVATD